MTLIAPGATRRGFALFLKGGLSVALIAWVARHFDPGTFAYQLRGANIGLIALAAGLIFMQTAVGAIRWQAIIVALRGLVGFSTTFQIYYIGVFFSTCPPGGVVGDIVRVWHAHRAGLALPSAISSVVFDRVVVLIVLMVASLAAVSFLPLQVRFEFPAGEISLILFLGVLACLTATVALRRLPEKWQSKGLVRKIITLSDRMRSVLARPASLIWVLIFAVLSQAILCVSIYILALSVDIRAGYLLFLMLMPPVLLAAVMPISIGGWGVRETAMVFVLHLIGVAPERAFLLSVLVGILAIAVSLPGGVLWLLSPQAKIRSSRSESPSAREAHETITRAV